MADIALLGIGVDSTGVKKANDELDKMPGKGAAAEGATKRLTAATDLLTRVYKDLAKALAAYKVLEFVKETTLLSARFETMGIVMGVAGNNAGYTRKQMADLEMQLRGTGISMLKARDALTSLATANIDLSKATGLARAAQDLAVVANINSSDALTRMVHGIKSGETEVLKTMGLNVSFEASYKKLAAQLHTTSDKLTEQQKTMARTNAVMTESVKYQGIYEEAMGTAGKQVTSLTRYWEDLKVKLGDTFLPAFTERVQNMTEALKDANKAMDDVHKTGAQLDFAEGLKTTFIEATKIVNTLGASLYFLLGFWGRVAAAIAATAVNIKETGGNYVTIKAIWEGVAEQTEAAVAGTNAYILKTNESKAATKAEAEAAKLAADQKAAAKEQERMAAGKVAREAQAAEEKRLKAQEDADKAAKAAKGTYEGWLKSIREFTAEQVLQLKMGRDLTEIEKLEVKIKTELGAVLKGLSPAQRKNVENKLAEARAAWTATDADKKRLEAAIALQEYLDATNTEMADHAAAMASAEKQTLDALYAQRDALEDANKLTGAEAGLVGATAKQRNITLGLLRVQLQLTRDIAAIDSNMMLDQAAKDRAKAARELNAELERQGVIANANIAEQTELIGSMDKTAHDVFVGILSRSKDTWTRAKDAAKAAFFDWLYSMVAKKWVISIGASMTGTASMAGQAADAMGGASSLGSMGSMASSLSGIGSAAYAGFTGATAAGSAFAAGGAASGAFGVGVGATGALEMGTLAGGALAGGGAAAGAGGVMAGLGAGLAAIPVVGWIALAAIAIYKIFGKKGGGPKDVSTFDYGEQGTQGEAATQLADAMQKQYGEIAAALGLQNRALANLGIHFAKDPKGDAQTMLDVTVDGYSRGSRMGTTENVDRTDEAFAAAVAEEQYRVIAHTLKAQADLNVVYKDWLGEITDATPYEKIVEIVDHVTRAGGERALLEAKLFDLTATEAEKLAKVRDVERATVDASNLSLLEQIYAQQDLQAALDGTTERVRSLAEIQQEAADLQERLFNLTHNEAEKTAFARDKELKAADASNRALLREIYATEDAIAAADKLTEARKAEHEAEVALLAKYEGLAREATAAAQALEQSRVGLAQFGQQLLANRDAIVETINALRGQAVAARDAARATATGALQAVKDADTAAAAALVTAQANVETAMRGIAQAVETAAARMATAEANLAAAREQITAGYLAAIEREQSAADAVTAARDQITNGYLAALSREEAVKARITDEYLAAQQQVANLMRQGAQAGRGILDVLQEFAQTDLGMGSSGSQAGAARAQFEALYAAAMGGDVNAQEQIAAQGKVAAQAAQDTAGTQAEALAATLDIRQKLAAVAAFALQGAPADDPAIVAQHDLEAALDRLAAAQALVTASGASTVASNTSLADEYTAAAAETAKWSAAVNAAGASLTATNVDLLAGYNAAAGNLLAASADVAEWTAAVQSSGAAFEAAHTDLLAGYTAALSELDAASASYTALVAATEALDLDQWQTSADAWQASLDALTVAQGARTAAETAANLAATDLTTALGLATAAGITLADAKTPLEAFVASLAAVTLTQADYDHVLGDLYDSGAGLAAQYDTQQTALAKANAALDDFATRTAGIDLALVTDQLGDLLNAYNAAQQRVDSSKMALESYRNELLGTATGQKVQSAYNQQLGRDPELEGLTYWYQKVLSGYTDDQLTAGIQNSPEYRAAHGLPAFASGTGSGMFGGGWAMVGEDGPELAQFGGPTRIYNASQTSAMVGGSRGQGDEGGEVLAEMRQARREMKSVYAELIYRVQNVDMRLKKFDEDGLPAEREAN